MPVPGGFDSHTLPPAYFLLEVGVSGPGPLAGVAVLELSQTVAAAYCGRLLASLGAQVVKVEPPEGDPLRRQGPFPDDIPDPEASALFVHLHRGKRSVTLRPQTATGRSLLEGLIGRSQVLVHDLPPPQATALGLDPASLRQRHPRLVAAAISYFGADGPYAHYRGSELVVEAVSGYMSITGDPQREPLKVYGHLAHYQAGLQAAVAVLAALLEGEASGQGEVADVSMAEATTFLMGGPPLLAQLLGLVLRRNGNRLIGLGDRHPYPSTLRPCGDGWVHAHVNYRYPELLAALLEDPWLASPQVLGAMSACADDIDARLDRWLADKSRREATQLAQEMRLPFTEVLDPAEVLADSYGHHASRGNFLTVRHPTRGDMLVVASPLKSADLPDDLGPPPLLGQHNREVLGEWLGLSPQEVVQLRSADII